MRHRAVAFSTAVVSVATRLDAWSVGPLLLLVLVLGCAEADHPAGSSRQPTPSLTGAVGNPEMTVAWAVAVASETTFAVVESAAQEVHVYSVDGSLITKFGGRGAGPGEYVSATAIAATGDGGFAVADMVQRRIQFVRPTGEALATVPLPGPPIGMVPFGSGSVGVLWDAPGVGPVFGVVSGAVASPRTLFTVFERESSLAVTNQLSGRPSPFLALGAAGNAHAYLATPAQYAIYRFDSSGHAAVAFARPDAPSEPYSDAELEEHRHTITAAAARSGVRMPEEVMNRALAEMRSRPRPFFPLTGVVSAPGGAWVITNRVVGDSTEIDVFDATGTYQGMFRVRDRVRAIGHLGSSFVAIVERGTARASLGPIDIYDVVE